MTPLVAIAGTIAVRGVGEVSDRTGGHAMLFLIFLGVRLAATARAGPP